jgi:Lysyl oxidase
MHRHWLCATVQVLVVLSLLLACASAPPSLANRDGSVSDARKHTAERPRRAAPTLLMPDLRPSPPDGVEVARGPRGQWALVFNTRVENVGTGPLELVPQRTPCVLPDGRRQGRIARQRIYIDVDRDGAYHHGLDTVYTEFDVGCFAYHRAHRHWHYKALMSYQISDNGGGAALTSSKMGFCLLDMVPLDSGSPKAHYVGDRSGDITRLPCLSSTTQGLSPSWADLYGSDTPGQSVDITNLPPGSYCLSFVVSRDGVLEERTLANNSVGTLVKLTQNRDVRELGRCGESG